MIRLKFYRILKYLTQLLASCNPIGILFLSYPIGVDIAGKPVKLNIFVKAVHVAVAVAQDSPSKNGVT